ncbi:MAG: HAD hydrolase-like protein, partial [Clostridia bacterium]|nr:HAD hydrolase-like protein [Clostridia bacterium]
MNKYKTIIFDMDGTLLDTLTDLWASLNYALKACGYPERTREEIQAYIGDGVAELIARAMPDGLKVGIEEDEARKQAFISACEAVGEEFRKYYIEHGEDNTRPYAGIMSLLGALGERGIKTAVVSNKVQ